MTYAGEYIKEFFQLFDITKEDEAVKLVATIASLTRHLLTTGQSLEAVINEAADDGCFIGVYGCGLALLRSWEKGVLVRREFDIGTYLQGTTAPNIDFPLEANKEEIAYNTMDAKREALGSGTSQNANDGMNMPAEMHRRRQLAVEYAIQQPCQSPVRKTAKPTYYVQSPRMGAGHAQMGVIASVSRPTIAERLRLNSRTKGKLLATEETLTYAIPMVHPAADTTEFTNPPDIELPWHVVVMVLKYQIITALQEKLGYSLKEAKEWIKQHEQTEDPLGHIRLVVEELVKDKEYVTPRPNLW